MRVAISRLAVRIYLIGLAQIAVIVAGASVLWSAALPREVPSPPTLARYVADRVADAARDPAALVREIARARIVIATVDVFDENGEVVLPASQPSAPRCWAAMPADGASTQIPQALCFARRTVLANGQPGYVAVKVPRFPAASRVIPVALGLPLFVVAISSLLLSRTLAYPLERMSATARAFGAANACAGSWQLAHASDPEADNPGSKNSARPMAVNAAAEGVLSNEFK